VIAVIQNNPHQNEEIRQVLVGQQHDRSIEKAPMLKLKAEVFAATSSNIQLLMNQISPEVDRFLIVCIFIFTFGN